VKKMAAAILVDDFIESKTDSGKVQETRRKRTPEEIKQIEELAKAAIGFDSQRGDLFSLQNISFVQAPPEIAAPNGKVQKVMGFVERWTGVLRYAALLAIFLLVYLLVLRPVQRQVMGILKNPGHAALGGRQAAGLLPEGAEGEPGQARESGSIGVSNTGEVFDAIRLKKELVNKVKADPESASRLLQNWVRETGPKAQ
jgi:flagellar M-ring protein FliF